MNNRVFLIIFMIMASIIMFTSQSFARPRDEIAKIKPIAKLAKEDQLKKDKQKVLQDWFLDNVKYYNSFLSGMEIESQGIVKINSYGKINAVLGAPGTDESGKYYVLFQKASSPNTLSPYITFPSDNITVNGQNDNTCNHEGLHAVLGKLSFSEVYHYSLSATQDDAPKYYNGSSQPEKIEHVYIENSQALIEWLNFLKQGNFEQAVISAGDNALSELKKKDPNATEVDFNKLDMDIQKKLLQPVKDIYFSTNVVNRRNDIYPMSATLKKELLDHCGITFANPDEVEAFYKNGGLKTSSGKKILIPEWFFMGDSAFTTSVMSIKVISEEPYINVSDSLLESSINVRVINTADYNNGNYVTVNKIPNKGIVTFRLDDQSDDTFIGVSVLNNTSQTTTDLKTGKFISFDIAEYLKKEAANKPSMFTFIVKFYLKNPDNIKSTKSYNLFIKYDNTDYARKISPNVYDNAIKDYAFKVDPSKFEVKIQSTNVDNKYQFKVKSYKPFKEYNWVIIDEKRSELYNSTISSDTLSYTFKTSGQYEVTVRPLNDKNKYVKGAKLTIKVDDKTKDKVDTAFEKRDYKTLCFSTNGNQNLEQVKRALKYLRIIADEFLVKDKELLNKFESFQKEDESAYNKALAPINTELDKLRKDNDKGKNNEAINKLNKCLEGLINAHDAQKSKIESSIKTIKDAIEVFENYYTNINPDESVNKDAPQVFMYEMSDNIKTKLEFDPDKPLVVYDYKATCSVDGTVNVDNNFKLTLRASKNKAKANEQIALAVKLENTTCAGTSLKLYWENNSTSINGLEGVFVASAPGTYSPTVRATCDGKEIGSSTVTIQVTGNTTGKIEGLEDNQVYFGTKKEIKLKTDLIEKPKDDTNCSTNPNNPFCVDSIKSGSIKQVSGKDTSSASIYIPNPDDEDDEAPKDWKYKVLWQSNRNLTFIPLEIKGDGYSNFNTKVVFDRIENPILIWAEIYEFKDGDYETIGESDQVEIEVIPPKFELIFNPTQDKAKIGKEVKVDILSNPIVDPKIIDYRWIEPTDRMQLENGSISFKPKDGKTITLHVIARVPHYGDIVDDKIIDQYTPGEYIVTASLIGPKFDKDSQEWSAASKGLVTKKKSLVTGQAILAGVSILDFDENEANFEWKSNEGCHIDAGNYSQEVTVSRNEPGACVLDVIAYDKDKRRLGSDQTTFNVNPQDSGLIKDPKDKDKTTIDKDKAQKDKDQADKAQKEKEEKEQKEQAQKEAQAAIKKAEEEAAKGNFEEAIISATKANELDPENTNIKDKLETIKSQKEKTSIKIEEVKDNIAKGNFEKAEKIIKELEIEMPQNTIKDQLKTEMTKAKETVVSKTIINSKANIKKGDLKTAIEEMEKASKLNPNNTELKDLLTKTKQDKQKISELNEQFNEAMNEGDYVKADKILKEMKTISHYDPEVQSANTSLSNQSFTKRSELTNKLNNINNLINQGNIEQAISDAETLLSEAQKVTYGEGITADTSKLLNDLKNKKSICDSNIKEAQRLIEAKQYASAESIINNLKLTLPNYKPIIDIDNVLKQIKLDQNNMLNQQKELINRAYQEVNVCNYDQAIELINQAKALTPDNADVGRNVYDINNKNTIFLQDLERSKLYFNRGDLDFAKQELAKHESYCSTNSKFLEYKKLINDYYANKETEIAAKIAEIRSLLNAKEYTKTVDLAKQTRALNPNQIQLSDITELEVAALKKLNEQKGAINYINIVQTHLNQYNYEGCLSQLGVLDNQYPDCWEPASEWPGKISQLRSECQTKVSRLNLILPLIKEAVSREDLNQVELETALKLSDELVSLNPNNYDYGKYREQLKQKLAKIKTNTTTSKNTGSGSIYEQWKNKQNGQTWGQNSTKTPDKPVQTNKGSTWGATNQPEKTPQTNNNFKEKQIYNNDNIAACGFTQYGTFTINKALNVSILEAYYNWKQGQTTEQFSLYYNDSLLGNGTFAKKGCSPGTNWCNGQNILNKTLAPGKYTVKVADGRICQNSGTGGNGVIRIYSKDPNASSSDVVNNTKNVKPTITGSTSINNDQLAGVWDMVANVNYKFDLKIAVNNGIITGTMTSTNGSEPVDSVKGSILSNGTFKFQRIRTGSWVQNYTGRINGSKLTGNFDQGGQGNYGWNASRKSANVSSITTVAPSQPNVSSSSGFDGKYSGNCRIYSGSGTCTVVMNVSNNQVSGSIIGIIEGDNVNASFTGAIIMPEAQYSQKSASVKATITKGTIMEHSNNRMTRFTGSLSGTIYSSSKANGDLNFIITGQGDGPEGEWHVTRSGQTTSKPATTTATSTSKTSNLAPRVIFVNKSTMPVHFYGNNESCSPNNKVNAGQKHIRALMTGYSSGSTRTFYAGRNGSNVAKVDVPISYISQKGQTVYVIYDSSGRLNWSK